VEYRELVEGIKIPVLGLGTWQIGGGMIADSSRDEEEVAALRTGIELGMTHIDTAENYAAGHCEELVGEAIKPYKREDLFITTKVWPNHLRRDDLLASMKGSLSRLDLEYVDLYLIHWPNPSVPLRETMGALEECAEEGHTRFIGLSNFSAPLMEEAKSYLLEHRLVADQVEYNLIDQHPKGELLPYCQKNDVMLIAYTPLARGSLARLRNNIELDEVAEKYGKTPGQVALNWLIFQDKVVAIPKASKIEHLKENVGAVGWKLRKEDFEKLTKAFR